MMCVIMKAESVHVRQDVQYIRTMNKVEAENVNNVKQRTPESIFLSGHRGALLCRYIGNNSFSEI